jgi:hypothetical protein
LVRCILHRSVQVQVRDAGPSSIHLAIDLSWGTDADELMKLSSSSPILRQEFEIASPWVH